MAWHLTVGTGFDRALMGRLLCNSMYAWNEIEKLAGMGTADDEWSPFYAIDQMAIAQGYSGARPAFVPLTTWLMPDESETTFPAFDSFDDYVLDGPCELLETNIQRLRDAIDSWIVDVGSTIRIRAPWTTAKLTVTSTYTYKWENLPLQYHEVMRRTGSAPDYTYERWATRAGFFRDAYEAYFVEHSVQEVSLTGSPTGGTFQLTYAFHDSGLIPWNATAAQVKTALESLVSIGAENLYVTGDAGGPWRVQFVGTMETGPILQISGDGAGLTGGTAPDVSIDTDPEPDTDWFALGDLMEIRIWAQMQAVIDLFAFMRFQLPLWQISRFTETSPTIPPYPDAARGVQVITVTGSPASGSVTIRLPSEIVNSFDPPYEIHDVTPPGYGYAPGTATFAVAYNATAAAVLAAINAAGGSAASVTGSAGGPWTVTFSSYAPRSAMAKVSGDFDIDVSVSVAGSSGDTPDLGTRAFIMTPVGLADTDEAWACLVRTDASLTVAGDADDDSLLLSASGRYPGVSGNGITFEMVCEPDENPPPAYTPLQAFSVDVTSSSITVHLATNEDGEIVTTMQDVWDGIEDSLAASRLVTVSLPPGETSAAGLAFVYAETSMSGGLLSIAEAGEIELAHIDNGSGNFDSVAVVRYKKCSNVAAPECTIEIVADGPTQTPDQSGAITITHSITDEVDGKHIVIHVPEQTYKLGASGITWFLVDGVSTVHLKAYIEGETDLDELLFYSHYVTDEIHSWYALPYISDVAETAFPAATQQVGERRTGGGSSSNNLYFAWLYDQYWVSGPISPHKRMAFIEEDRSAGHCLELAYLDASMEVVKAEWEIEANYATSLIEPMAFRFNELEVEIATEQLPSGEASQLFTLDLSDDPVNGIQHIVPGTDLELFVQVLDWPKASPQWLLDTDSGAWFKLNSHANPDIYVTLPVTHGEEE